MEGDLVQLFFLKTVLSNFSQSTGLKVNYNKSLMLPINVPEQRLKLLANTFGCQTGTLPFTYLGLPLGTTKPRIIDFLPLVNKCERRLGGISDLLNQAGRLQVTNAVFSSLPTYYMCTLEIPKAVIKQIDKFRKSCLWRGNNANGTGQPKVAWKLVCKDKSEGGLGIIDLKTQNQALLMKNLDKFFNKKEIPWVHMVWEKLYSNNRLPAHTRKGSFWWRSIIKLLPLFKGFAQIQINNGKTCFLWHDQWQTRTLEESYPQLYSFAKNKSITLHKALATENCVDLFNLPLSLAAHQQFTLLQQSMSLVQINNQMNDVWTFFGNNSVYSSSKAYKRLMGHQQIEPAFHWIWKSPCQPKHKVLCWLLLNDRLSTRKILLM